MGLKNKKARGILSFNGRSKSCFMRHPKSRPRATSPPVNFYPEIEKALAQHAKDRESQEPIRLGENIRWLREKASITGVELCRRSRGIDPRTLSAIEKGRIRNPSLETLQKIAAGLGCLVRDLFTRAEMAFERNYHVGSQKGVFQIEFPKLGLKILSATPPVPQFFCGKSILSPQRKVTGELFYRSAPLFLEVVMGRIEFGIEDQTVTLKEGENLFFNGGLRHFFQNLLSRESALWLVTAPSFFHS